MSATQKKKPAPKAAKPAEAKAEPKEAPVSASEPKAVRPKLFCAPDEDIVVAVTGYYANATGELAFVTPDGDAREAESFTPLRHEFTFTRVPYNRLNIYRSQAMHYKEEGTGTAGVDVLKLRDFLWTFHLKSWNLRDEADKPVPLKHDPDGTLSDASRRLLNRLPAALLDTVITLFERKANIA